MSCLNILNILVLFLSFSGSSFSPWRMSSFIIAEVLLTAAFRSEFPSDLESFFSVEATSGGVVTGSVNGRLTLPCTSTDAICWERGGCSFFECDNAIIRTDGQKVTWWKSERYQLLGNISQGNVSLTITGVTKQDEGTYYCCMNSFFNGHYTVEVKITADPEVREFPTVKSKTITDSSTTKVRVVTNSLDVAAQKTASIGNIIRGILIFLLPPLFLLIYKCCSL
ncbi:hepatitis A virus cellular receptor 1 homolog [Phyllobates terribilis]|uniref:hepatitis A virus cellular receptor 1 homolog n=1 Tax=Phyllobates terribilis TaxID=111132 RepID=UPI003CCB71EC